MERRQSRRKAVQGPDEILVTAPDYLNGQAPAMLCRISDISPHGMRLLARGAIGSAGFMPGQRLCVAECPRLLTPLLVERGLQVVWSEGPACGVRFDSPLRCSLEEWDAGAAFVSF